MTSKLKEIDAFILIGGQSRRFGEKKCLIEYNGQSLTEIVYSNIVDFFKKVSIVGKKNYFDKYSFISDEHKIQCPMNGINTALEVAHSEWIFVIACDMPLINSRVIDYFDNNIDFSQKALIPQMDGKLQPLCGFYKKSIRENLKLAIKNEEYSLYKVINKLDIAKIAIPLSMKSQFLNINYPNDLEKLSSNLY